MINIEFIKNSSLNNDLMYKIINLKNQHWPYSLESQKLWMKNNLGDEDIHVCILFNSDLIAYLNLTTLEAKVNKNDISLVGLGNVCVDKRHLKMGWGNLVICVVNTYLKENKKNGILLCKSGLINFYKKNGWSLMNTDNLSIIVNNYILQESCMMYCPPELSGELKINKNF